VTKNVIKPSEANPTYGNVVVQQRRSLYDEKGWLRLQTISALIAGSMDDLEEMEFKDGQELPGRIIVRESLKPFNEKDPDRDLKIAGETKVVCRVGGAAIYRKAFYTENSEVKDELIQHDNVEEIRQAYEQLKAAEAEKQPDLHQ